jgi:hypothetical protein
MESHLPFRESRREPTDRRSWRQTPVFVGDLAAHVDHPNWLMFVTGILPRGCLEVVNVERARRAVGDIRSLDDLNSALAEGRIMPRALPRRELAPATEEIAQAAGEIPDATADADSEVPA